MVNVMLLPNMNVLYLHISAVQSMSSIFSVYMVEISH
jgi:hypothetical protein